MAIMMTITHNTDDLVSSIENKIKDITNLREPLRETDKAIHKEYSLNFDFQGFRTGKAWSKLAKSTQKQRARLGFGAARPILIRTGKLQRGLNKGMVNRNKLLIKNSVDYAIYHQEGTSKIPKRPLFLFTKRMKRTISQIFINHIKESLR